MSEIKLIRQINLGERLGGNSKWYKHDRYLRNTKYDSYYNSDVYENPKYFYFGITESMADKCVKALEDTRCPYGLLCITTVNPEFGFVKVDVLKKAYKLEGFKQTTDWSNICNRLTSESMMLRDKVVKFNRIKP